MKKTPLSSSHLEELKEIFAAPIRDFDLDSILDSYILKRPELRGVTRYKILTKLIEKKSVYAISLLSEYKEQRLLFCSNKDINPYIVASRAWPRSYFCNLTAAFYHKLTNQVPSSIYLAIEGKGRLADIILNKKTISLTDHNIFQAFIKENRTTRNAFEYGDYSIIVTERMDRNYVGTIEVERDSFLPPHCMVTDLERTLIDSIVNPHYSGGISSVISYFVACKKSINAKHLIKLYKLLGYVYPYWQTIGFICEKVGILELSEELLKEFKIKNKFYIDHNAKTSWLFDEKWQIYYPSGLI
jgi:predicted transcriptional regulator of viral defense system